MKTFILTLFGINLETIRLQAQLELLAELEGRKNLEV